MFSFQSWRISHTETIRALTEPRGVYDLRWQQLSKTVLTLLWATTSELLCQPSEQFTLPRQGFSSGTSYSIGLMSVPIIPAHCVPFNASPGCGVSHGQLIPSVWTPAWLLQSTAEKSCEMSVIWESGAWRRRCHILKMAGPLWKCREVSAEYFTFLQGAEFKVSLRNRVLCWGWVWDHSLTNTGRPTNYKLRASTSCKNTSTGKKAAPRISDNPPLLSMTKRPSLGKIGL